MCICKHVLRQVLALADSDVMGSAQSDQLFDASQAEGGLCAY